MIFWVKGQRNYCKHACNFYLPEAIIMLLQYHCLLFSCIAARLKWSRLVNTTERVGKTLYVTYRVGKILHVTYIWNISIDKDLITDLWSNISSNSKDSIYPSNAIKIAAWSISVLHHICNNFDERNIKVDAFVHNTRSLKMDTEIAQEVLKQIKGSDHYSKQKHSPF